MAAWSFVYVHLYIQYIRKRLPRSDLCLCCQRLPARSLAPSAAMAKRSAPGNADAPAPKRGCGPVPALQNSQSHEQTPALQPEPEPEDTHIPEAPPELQTETFDGGRATVTSTYLCECCKTEFPVASFLIMSNQKGEVPYLQEKELRVYLKKVGFQGAPTVLDVFGRSYFLLPDFVAMLQS